MVRPTQDAVNTGAHPTPIGILTMYPTELRERFRGNYSGKEAIETELDKFLLDLK
jgi:hypothetical protein